MPTTTVKAPDGTEIPVRHPEGASQEEIISYAQKNYRKPEPEEQGRSLMDNVIGATQNFANGALLGAQDEISGFVGAAVDYLQDPEGQSFADRLELFTKDRRDSQVQWANDNPAAALALEVAGGFATGGATVKGLSLAVPKVANSAVTLGAASGAVDGTIYGFMDADYDWNDRFTGALTGGLAGGVLGGAAGKGIETITNRLVGKRGAKAANEARETMERIRENYALAKARGLDDVVAESAALTQAKVDKETLGIMKGLTGEDLNIGKYTDLSEDALEQIRASRRKGVTPTSALRDGSIPGFDTLEKFGGVVSTTVRSIDQPLFNSLRRYERDVMQDTTKYMKLSQRFEKAMKNLSPNLRRQVEKNLFNGRTDEVRKLLKGVDNEALGAVYAMQRQVIRPLRNQLKAVGYKLPEDYTGDYWPRKVKQVDKLREQMNRTPQDDTFRRRVEEARKKKIARGEGELTKTEMDKIYNSVMSTGIAPRRGNPNVKGRTIEFVNEDILPYYSDSVESLTGFIHSAVNDVHTKRMFNRSASGASLKNLLSARAAGGDEEAARLIQDSVGELIQRSGHTGRKAEKLKDVFNARFGPGQMGMSKGAAHLKNLGVVGTLGNLPATAIQFADTAQAMYKNGVRNAVQEVATELFNATARRVPGVDKAKFTRGIDLADIGVDNRILADLDHAEGLNKLVDNVLTYSGFKGMDRFGKRVVVNSAWRNMRQQAKKNPEALRKKWGTVFLGETDDFIADVSTGNVSDNVRLALFHELSDVQPITPSEMPLAWLQSPNGRLAYTLKSYALKQLDILRRDVWQTARKGQYKEAFTNAARYMMAVTMMNGSVDLARDAILRGEELTPEDIPDAYIDQLFALTIFGNRYNQERFFNRSEYDYGLWATLMPAGLGVGSDMAKVVEKTVKGEPEEASYRWFPVVGQLIDDFILED